MCSEKACAPSCLFWLVARLSRYIDARYAAFKKKPLYVAAHYCSLSQEGNERACTLASASFLPSTILRKSVHSLFTKTGRVHNADVTTLVSILGTEIYHFYHPFPITISALSLKFTICTCTHKNWPRKSTTTRII